MWTVSAFQQHPNTMIVVDEVRIFPGISFPFERLSRSFSKLNFSCAKDATLELRVRTVKYFKDMWQVFESITFTDNWGFEILTVQW